jgi:phospholipase D-like protein
MARLFVFILLIDLVLVVMALVACLSAADTAVRGLPRIAWVFVILLTGPVGALAWFVAGRPVVEFRISNPRTGPQPVRRPRAVGPDDDPEFLRGLGEAIRTRNARES